MQVDDVILEIVLEEFIETYVIEPELEEELPEIAKDILEHYDTKIEKKELKEVCTGKLSFNNLIFHLLIIINFILNQIIFLLFICCITPEI